jgi:predicted AlkP superfamily pyrophosphatase or phosphodiesterase
VSTPAPLVVLDVVGLTPRLLDSGAAPHLARLAGRGHVTHLREALPAVTCTSQSCMLTGALPRTHGIVGNGWYFRDLAEVWLWRQSNHLVTAEKVWETARRTRPGLTCAKLFWWYDMYSSADVAVTPRPLYPADGRKLPDIHTAPAALRHELQGELGPFPLFDFWGPKAGLPATRWIARCARRVFERFRPDLTLVYLPHLDYDLQRLGPDDPRIGTEVRAVDDIAGDIIEAVQAEGARVLVTSEYGVEAATGVVHVNRVLREAGLTALRDVSGTEHLDPGASRAFAVADHQIAHVYVREPADVPRVRALLAATPGIERVFGDDDGGKAAEGLDHPRAGELVCLAAPGHWFTYYWWLDDARAPDFARTVDIHRKPGYDPAELFFDPHRRAVKLRAAARLAQKLLGFRYLMDVIGLDASIVRGTHGRRAARPEDGPLLIDPDPPAGAPGAAPITAVRDVILGRLLA